MQNAWNEIVTFFRMMEQNGAYYGIGLLAVLFSLRSPSFIAQVSAAQIGCGF